MKLNPNSRHLRAGSTLAGVTAVLSAAAFAVDNSWTGAVDQNWNDVGNWSLGRLPANPNGQPAPDDFDDAIINATVGYPVVTADTAGTPRDIMVGAWAGNAGQLDHVAGNVTYNGWFYIGRGTATGVYNLADVSVAGPGLTGFGQGSGSLTYTANGRLWVGGTWASEGVGGSGTFNVNTSGTITINDLAVGSAGHTGVMNVDSGTINTSGWNFIGKNEGVAGANGTLNMAGGTLTNTGETHVGEAGTTGALNLTGGSYLNVNNAVFVVGLNEAGIGSVTVNSPASVLQSTGELWFGQGNATATGTLNFMAGAINSGNWVAIGRGGGTGNVTMTGGTWTKTGGGNFIVGASGPGTMDMSGGLVDVQNGVTWVAEGNNCTGTLTLSGTAEFRTSVFSVGVNGGTTGTLNLNGGTARTGQFTGGGGADTVNFNGTQVVATAFQTAFITNFDTANIDTGGLLVDTNGFAVTAPQALSGTGGVVKSGAGTLTLSGANSYNGLSTVSAGTLVLTTNATGGGDVAVADGAALGVTQVTDTASLAAANVTLGSAGATTLEIDLGNIVGNPTAAPLNVTGTLTLNGPVTLNVADDFPAVGTVPLVSYVAPIAGSGSIALGTLPPGVAATLVDDGAGLIYLNVTSASLPRWNGDVDGNWDTTTANWIDQITNAATTYADPAPVLFNDDATGTTLVALDTTVAPSQVVFNNSIGYWLTGSGSITGSTSLLKQGGGTLSLLTANDYTGPTVLEGGTTTINTIANGGAASSIGASPADAANLVLGGGTLSYTGPAASIDRGFTIAATGSGIATTNSLTMSGPVVTTVGNLVKTGAGNLTLTNPGANVFGTVNQGLKVNGGTLTLDGSGTQTNTVAGEMWLASAPDVAANLVLNNTSLTTASWLAMGRGNGATGMVSTLTATNSTITTANFSTGYDAGLANDSDQNVTLTDSTWTNNGVTLLAESVNSTTTMLIEGTSVYNAGGRFSIGLGDASLATVTVKDSAQLIQSNGGWVSIGNGGILGTGVLNIQDNAVAIFSNVDFNVSDVGTSVGTVNVSGAGTLNVNGVAYIGKNTGTSGTVNLSGGSMTCSRFVHIGQATGSTGAVTITDGTFTGGGTEDFQIGVDGQGTWTQSGGTTNANSWVAVGRNTGSVGVLTVSGGTFNQTGAGNALLVGEVGTGTLTISGTGAVNAAGSAVVVSNAAEAVGTVNLDGGTLTARQVAAWAGGAGLATVNFNGGLLVAGAGANASFINTLDAANVLAGGAVIDTNGQAIAIDQALLDGGGGGGLTKTGAGTLTLTAVNTYAGNTTVGDGALALADNAALRFVIGANGVCNKLTGPGAATLDGDFNLDVSGADTTAGNSWTLVDVATPTYGATFTVAGFVENADVWTMGAGGKLWTFTEATGVLTVADGTTYATWINGFFPGETDPAIVGSDADPDNDSIPNCVEMVVGGDPKDGMDVALLPTIELVTDPAGLPAGNWVLFTYRRTDLAVAAGLAIAGEYSVDLLNWAEAQDGVDGVVILEDDNYAGFDPPATDTDRVRIYAPQVLQTLFGRLKVTVP